MRCNRWIAAAILAVILLPVTAFASSQRVPPGSFLRVSALTTGQLSAAVRTDATVASRYSRHYRMSRVALSSYFKSNLRAGMLKRAGIYTMYFIDDDGKIISHRVRLDAKEPVFFAANGSPVIDIRCGNPITKSLPTILDRPRPVSSASVSPAVAEISDPILQSADADPEIAENAEIIPQYEKIAGIQQVTQLTAPPAATMVASSLNIGSVVSGLAGAGSIGIILSKHKNSPPHKPVPEPSGFVAFGACALPMLYTLFKKSSQRTA